RRGSQHPLAAVAGQATRNPASCSRAAPPRMANAGNAMAAGQDPGPCDQARAGGAAAIAAAIGLALGSEVPNSAPADGTTYRSWASPGAHPIAGTASAGLSLPTVTGKRDRLLPSSP